MTQITDNAERKFELWFFRDLTDTQRRMLFTLFGMPVHEITHQGSQRQVFKHVLKALTPSPETHVEGRQEECDFHRAAEADFQDHVNYLRRAREWE